MARGVRWLAEYYCCAQGFEEGDIGDCITFAEVQQVVVAGLVALMLIHPSPVANLTQRVFPCRGPILFPSHAKFGDGGNQCGEHDGRNAVERWIAVEEIDGNVDFVWFPRAIF